MPVTKKRERGAREAVARLWPERSGGPPTPRPAAAGEQTGPPRPDSSRLAPPRLVVGPQFRAVPWPSDPNAADAGGRRGTARQVAVFGRPGLALRARSARFRSFDAARAEAGSKSADHRSQCSQGWGGGEAAHKSLPTLAGRRRLGRREEPRDASMVSATTIGSPPSWSGRRRCRRPGPLRPSFPTRGFTSRGAPGRRP